MERRYKMKTEEVSEKKQFKFFKALESALGEENVSDNLAVRSAYRGTNFNILLPWWGKGPKFVVLPKTVEHVQEVVKLAKEEKLTILPVCLGTITAFWEADIVMDMMGMDRIITIDPENSYVVVEPGVTYSRLGPLLRKEGYTIAIGSFPATFSVLGNLGARRGFNHNFSARFSDQTLGLEIVVADGTLLRTGTATFGLDYWSNLSQDMPDIRGLFGPTNQKSPIFGIVTKAALRIWPMMEARGLPIGVFDSFETAMKYSQKVAKAGIADQSMVWNWVNVGFIETLNSPTKEKDFFNYIQDTSNEYNKPPKGLRYNYTWTQFRGYKEQVEVNLQLCKRIAKEVGGRILEEDEIQDTIPETVNYWRKTYIDLVPPDEIVHSHLKSMLSPGPLDVWYFMGWVNDLIKLEEGYNRRLKEKYHWRMQAYYVRLFDGGVGGALRYMAWTDMQDNYQAMKQIRIREEMHSWVLENYPNIHAYFGGNRTVKNSIGMGSVLDKVRSALDPDHILYLPDLPGLPGRKRLEPEG
jgi:hypothetical protein